MGNQRLEMVLSMIIKIGGEAVDKAHRAIMYCTCHSPQGSCFHVLMGLYHHLYVCMFVLVFTNIFAQQQVK